MCRKTVLVGVATVVLAGAGAAWGASFSYSATLAPVNPNFQSGSGAGSVVLDDVANTLTINLSWQGLSTTTTAAHIHGPLPATGVLIPGPSFPGFSNGPATGNMAQQVLAYTPTQIATFKGYFDNSQTYFNIHTGNVPSGEIQGIIRPVPEPASLAMLGMGAWWAIRRRRIA